jgi:hypothetical protein
MCGLKRNYEEIKSTLHDHLISDLQSQNAEIDSFVHCDKPIELLNLRGAITEDPEKYENITIQIARFHECYHKLVLPYMNKHKIEYDFFVCTRPDNIYFEKCLKRTICEWDKNKINTRMRIYPTNLNLIYHTGWLNHGIETVDDQFFIIPKNIANLAFSVKYGKHPILCEVDWEEGKLTKLWNSYNLKFELLPINTMIYNWKYDCGKIYDFRKKIELESNYFLGTTYSNSNFFTSLVP